jgi:secretion/DNA translocation related TadE-like protein
MNDRGSASVVALGWIAMLVLGAGVFSEVAGHVLTAHRLQGAVDRAALAAGDVLIGVVPGLPCDSARQILRHEQFSLDSCELEESRARVTGTVDRRGIRHSAHAHAGVADGGQK